MLKKIYKFVFALSFYTNLYAGETVVRAAIDFGSITLKMQVADIQENRIIQSLLNENITINLAEDISLHDGSISHEMEEKALATLRGFKKDALRVGGEKVAFAGIATPLFDKAKNGKAVLQKIEQELGIPFCVLSPEEEGELTFMSARALNPDVPEDNLIAWDSGDRAFLFIVKDKNQPNLFRVPLGHGVVRDILARDLRHQKLLLARESGNPVTDAEAAMLKERIHNLLPPIPDWLHEKLLSSHAVVSVFGDGENNFSILAQAKEKGASLPQAILTQADLNDLIHKYINKDDAYFDSACVHRKTFTKALFISTLMDYFGIQKVLFKRVSGNTSGLLISPRFWDHSL